MSIYSSPHLRSRRSSRIVISLTPIVYDPSCAQPTGQAMGPYTVDNTRGPPADG
eukprot:m.115753 g.115753  ORF g.115753 m.115753 type:complete len:54 (-) comp21584_c0_seq4:1827-1988(-)